jgi:hypothetical protein
MSIMTAARKVDRNGSGHFMSISHINHIKRAQELDGIFTKRRQAKFDASPKRRKDGMPYQAHRQCDNIMN